MFSITHRIKFHETDMAGIVHFAHFYRYMEEAEHAYFRSLGLSVSMPQPDGSVMGWPRVRSQCTFEAPAYFEEVIEVRLNVARIGVKSLTFEVEFYRDETRIAHGSLKTACCLVEHGQPLRSVPIPDEILDKINASR